MHSPMCVGVERPKFYHLFEPDVGSDESAVPEVRNTGLRRAKFAGKSSSCPLALSSAHHVKRRFSPLG